MRHIYGDFVDQVTKPARYLGGEYLSVVKDPATVDARIVLAFPDVYDIGMSHLGTKILYSVLNKDERIAAERSFTPWVDMEAELRHRALPLVSLESSSPLSDFDVVGFSLQFELTFTNVLTMLDLGGIPLRSAERTMDAPLVLAGGPTATHAEPMAPFFDAFFIGEAEQELSALVLAWAAHRRAGTDRREALIDLAVRFPIYVPSLYATETCADTGMTVVGAPLDPRVPARVRRGVVDNLDDYPFPTDSPVPYAEAVFERASVEIARGCTEGCRFCQAGMIYRPVRERSPESIIETVLEGARKGGYDETGLTCLSTADYSSITPLVRKVVAELKPRNISMSVASLRAYGLSHEILDEMAQMRINGLTFAPEAGSQRMRDVVNKNVTEAHIETSSHRVFERGWNRLKLYFMIGLPTEEDDDVGEIVETGQKMLRIGRGYVGKRAEVTVSVSSHVPKPHTPFQWAAQDNQAELERKQVILRRAVTERGLRLKSHDPAGSFLEGVLSRGDRRLADPIEAAWRDGARFDSWDEISDPDRWRRMFAEHQIDTESYLGTRPVTARLPWDHIDVGLEEGFLLAEYKKALKSRLSPPCGKVAGTLVHHTNLAEAEADTKRLVCYDCGIACDLSKMRDDRLVSLRSLGAETPAPLRMAPSRVESAPIRGERSKPSRVDLPEVPETTYRLTYTKLGRVSYLGHLDTSRVIQRMLRRAELPIAYSRGFHPHPKMVFSPALSLGVLSLGEIIELTFEDPATGPLSAEQVRERLCEVCPEGIEFTSAVVVPPGQKSLAKQIHSYDLAILPPPDGMPFDEARLARIAAKFVAAGSVMVVRKEREVDIRRLVTSVDVVAGDAAASVCGLLGWTGRTAFLRARVEVSNDGSAKPLEVAKALGVWGADDPRATHAELARLGFPDLSEGAGVTAEASATSAAQPSSTPLPSAP